jgi:hypothetical protein
VSEVDIQCPVQSTCRFLMGITQSQHREHEQREHDEDDRRATQVSRQHGPVSMRLGSHDWRSS